MPDLRETVQVDLSGYLRRFENTYSAPLDEARQALPRQTFDFSPAPLEIEEIADMVAEPMELPDPEPDHFFLVSRDIIIDAWRGWFRSQGYEGRMLEEQAIQNSRTYMRFLNESLDRASS